MKHLIGVDIGGTNIKIGFFSLEMQLIEKWEIPTNLENKGNKIVEELATSIKEFWQKSNNKINECLGIGFGLPGAVINNCCFSCVNLGWDEKNIEEEIQNYFLGIRVKADNDANCAALGEYHHLKKARKSACLITLGTGVGGGIIYNGKILGGFNGASGEIGHMKVVFKNGRICGCGKKGCLETVISANGIKNVFQDYLLTSKVKGKFSPEDSLSAKEIFSIENKYDPVIKKTKKHFYHYLGLAISYITLVTNPEVIIIGGGVSKGLQGELKGIKKAFIKQSFTPSENTEIVLAKLENDAGIYGAAWLVKNA